MQSIYYWGYNTHTHAHAQTHAHMYTRIHTHTHAHVFLKRKYDSVIRCWAHINKRGAALSERLTPPLSPPPSLSLPQPSPLTWIWMSPSHHNINISTTDSSLNGTDGQHIKPRYYNTTTHTARFLLEKQLPKVCSSNEKPQFLFYYS